MNPADTDTTNRIRIDGPLGLAHVKRRAYSARRIGDDALVRWDHGGIADATNGSAWAQALGRPVEIAPVDPDTHGDATHRVTFDDESVIYVADLTCVDHVHGDTDWGSEWADVGDGYVEPCKHPPFVVNVEFDRPANHVTADERRAVREIIDDAIGDGSIIAKPLVGIGWRADVEVVECSHCRDEGEDVREATALVKAAAELARAFGWTVEYATERIEAALDAKRQRWREIMVGTAERRPVGILELKADADASKFHEGMAAFRRGVDRIAGRDGRA